MRRGGDLLFDCAEDAAPDAPILVGLVELREIFLTFAFHADHFLGLPGMLKTFALRGRELPITIYGPPLGRSSATCGACSAGSPIPTSSSRFRPGDVLARDDYRIKAFAPNHGRNAVGYALVEASPGPVRPGRRREARIPIGARAARCSRSGPVTLADGRVVTPDSVVGEARPGRKVVLAGDTAPAASVVEASHGADLLVHEATFAEEERGRAEETLHSTAAQAARAAQDAEVTLLADHLSRYFAFGDRRGGAPSFPRPSSLATST